MVIFRSVTSCFTCVTPCVTPIMWRYVKKSWNDEISNFEAKLSEMFIEFVEHGFLREKLICKFFQFANKYHALLFKFDLCT